jgi:hypothetical protein
MSYTLEYLNPGFTYHFVLESQSTGGGPAGFIQEDVTIPGAVVPGNPDDLSAAYVPGANASTGSVFLHWIDTSFSESGFIVQRSLDQVNWTTIGTTGADENEYSDSSAGPDSIYFYRVCATGDSSGNYNSGFTSTANVNTPGVSIQIQSQQDDPAGNPEISAMTGQTNLNNLARLRATVTTEFAMRY